MTALEKVKDWLGNYPGFDILSTFQVDYTSEVPGCGGLFPAGLVELGRRRDILGNTTVENQYNFALYYVFEKAPGDETGADCRRKRRLGNGLSGMGPGAKRSRSVAALWKHFHKGDGEGGKRNPVRGGRRGDSALQCPAFHPV